MWTKTIGGGGYEYAWSAIETSDGGFVVVGQTGSFGVGNHDIYLVKLDSDGNLIWTRTIGGTGWDYVSSVFLNTVAVLGVV